MDVPGGATSVLMAWMEDEGQNNAGSRQTGWLATLKPAAGMMTNWRSRHHFFIVYWTKANPPPHWRRQVAAVVWHPVLQDLHGRNRPGWLF